MAELSEKRFMGLRISSKLLLIMMSVSLAAALAAALMSGYSSNTALEQSAFSRLTAVRELKAQQIENYFRRMDGQATLLAADPQIISAIGRLVETLRETQAGVENSETTPAAVLTDYYENNYAARLRSSLGQNAAGIDRAKFLPSEAVARLLQEKYVAGATNDRTDFLKGYDRLHSKIHPRLSKLKETLGYRNLLLIEPDEGRIIYSVEKAVDFGTNLFNGPHSDTNLAEAVVLAMAARPGSTIFADFEPYFPSYGSPTAFVATPIYNDLSPIGVLALELPSDQINNIMTSNESWSEIGLGRSGETYIVGRDRLLRNQSRFLIEDRERYLKMIADVGLPASVVRQIATSNSSIGLQEVDTVGTRAALRGESGTQIFPDYRDVEVLSAFRPLDLPGLDWVIMSEIDRDEAFAAADRLIDRLILVTSVVLAIAVYSAYYFSLSLSRPLRSLASSAAELTAGRIDIPIKPESSDEIGDLAQSFEELRLSMQAGVDEVERQKSTLEQAVADRTAELNEASARLGLALLNMSNGIYMLDKDLNFVMHNDRYVELLGVPEQLIQSGRPISSEVRWLAENGVYGHGDEDEFVEARLKQLRSDRSVATALTTKMGRTIEIRTTPVSGGGVVGVATDITALKRKEKELLKQNDALKQIQSELELSEQRISKIIEASPVGVISIDRRGIIEIFSSAAEDIFGYYASDIIGKNIKILMLKDVALEHDLYLERRIQGAPSSVVGKRRIVDAVRKDGSIFKLEAQIEEVQIEDEVLYIGLIEDITERLELERQAELAREQAERANEAKSAFLANMSHELRTPMNAIIGYSEMLAEEAEDQGLDEMLGDLDKIIVAGKHLLSLINDVLDLSKIEAGKMDLYLEDFSVPELTKDVANTAISLVEKNGNKLVLDVEDDIGTMRSDVTKVRQILFNLISNAAKFTKAGTITLEAKPEPKRSEEFVKFVVNDTGIGIPEDKLEHIFQEFSQADESTTRDFGGTGLGLALTRRFCRMMGGSISVESTVGEGSSFFLELPRTVRKKHEGLEEEAAIEEDISGAPEESSQTAGQLPPGSNVILVIDDEATARELLKRNLEAEGCSVVTAKSGTEGLALAEKLIPALITLDIMMPGMDGWTVLKRLKSHPDMKSIPVVMVSMVGDRAMSYSLGAVESLQKPVDRTKLATLVKKFATGSRKFALVVDDDPAARSAITRMLKGENWEVEEAENGARALQLTAGKEFSLILLDLMMPVMDGFEFLERLRKCQHPSAHSPVIVVTAMDLSADDRKRLEINVQNVVQKSGGEVGEVINEIRRILDQEMCGLL